MNKRLIILILAGIFVIGLALLLRFGSFGTQALWNISSGGQWMAPLVSVSALIDSINPCAFGILLLTIAFLLSLQLKRSSILKIGGVYILGILAAYLAIGLGILETLHLFNTPHFVGRVGALLLIAFGAINLAGYFFPAFPIKLRVPQAAHNKIASLMNRASLPAAFLLGGLVGLCEFPCTGGPYLMVLGLLHDQGTYLRGFGYLLLYNVIFILPLVIILAVASNPAFVEKVQAWKKSETKHMRFWGSVAMIALGLLVLFL